MIKVSNFTKLLDMIELENNANILKCADEFFDELKDECRAQCKLAAGYDEKYEVLCRFDQSISTLLSFIYKINVVSAEEYCLLSDERRKWKLNLYDELVYEAP